jgi:hypothetical protein
MRGRFHLAAHRRSNKRMHATRDTAAFMFLNRAGGRVMRSVMRTLTLQKAYYNM